MNLFKDLLYPLLGFALIAAGAAWIYHPLGLIVAGVYFVLLSRVRAKTQ